jgi:cytochrome P450
MTGAAAGAADRARCPVDHHSPGYATGARALHQQLRQTCPVGWSDAQAGFWAVSRHSDAFTVLHDAATYRSGKELRDGVWFGGSTIPTTQRAPLLPLELDPPLGTKYRQLVMPWLTRTVVESHAAVIRAFADELLDRVIERGRFDVISDLGAPLPAMVVVMLLGLDQGDAERLAWPFHAYEAVPRNSPEFRHVVDEMTWLTGLLYRTCEHRRAAPGTDAISRLVTARVDGEPVPAEDCVGILMTVIGGGVDTTTAALAHTLLYLDAHRDDRDTLIADPSLIPHACEEFLRAFPPVWQLARRAGAPADLAGQRLAEGERVMVSVLSANHDESVFDRPGEVDLVRRPNPHVTFGAGVHRCAGSHVARFELRVMIERVLARMPDYRILRDQAEHYVESGDVDGWIAMPAVFTPGERTTAAAER